MSRLFFVIGIFLLFLTEILRVYFIMPFPGSQYGNSIHLAYSIEKYKWVFRIVGIFLVIGPLIRIFSNNSKIARVIASLIITFYLFIFFLFNFRFEADKMFYQPTNKNFLNASGSKIDSNRQIIGLEINGEAKAYPIQIIGYHHQIRDTVGNTPVMITYCTVCRTGRVYSPFVNGTPEIFRLVGMDHFNAMFEDSKTKSWWQQATGEAVAGPLKGTRLTEIPSYQSSLSAWLRVHPNSAILQPDPLYQKKYEGLADYDNGTIESSLERKDPASWKMKSWVVGVRSNGIEKAFDWNDLLLHRLIQDTIGQQNILLVLENDTSTFHAFDRNPAGHVLFFSPDISNNQLTDTNTHSIWNLNGLCISGSLKNTQLQSLAAYQEFWHSWKQFHPNTTVYKQ